MKSILALFTALILLLNTGIPVQAQTNDVRTALPEIQGEAAYLIDLQSGQTLFSKNPDEQLAPASTTKIMTGLLAIERGNLDDLVTTTSTMLDYEQVNGSRIYLEPGEQLPLGDLLYALLLDSANDAAVAITEYIGGDVKTFVDMMNERAKEIGANDTHFKNPSGLPAEGHVTTAHDLARIAAVAFQNPTFAEYVGTKTHTIARAKPDVPTTMYNGNKLLWRDSDVNGIKTGYTVVAGNCLVASKTKNGRTVIGVILKSPSGAIYPDMENMLNYGLNNFTNKTYASPGTAVSNVAVNDEQVNLVVDQPIWVTENVGKNIGEPVVKVNLPANELLEVEAGQIVGNVEVWEGNERLKVLPLRTDRTVKPLLSVQAKRLPEWEYYLLVTLILLTAAFWGRRRIRSVIEQKADERSLSEHLANLVYDDEPFTGEDKSL